MGDGNDTLTIASGFELEEGTILGGGGADVFSAATSNFKSAEIAMGAGATALLSPAAS